jgi:hypothetical protein
MAQTAFLQSIMCGDISFTQRVGACSDREIWPNFSKLALHGALDRYSSVAVDHLSRGPMTTTPHSHTTRHFHDQAVGGGNFRGGLPSVHRGSLHVHAEHYRECSSEADAGQSPYVYFHWTSPLFSFIDPNPSDDRGWELTVAQFGPFSNAERYRPARGPLYRTAGNRIARPPAPELSTSTDLPALYITLYHEKEPKTCMGIAARDHSRGSRVRRWGRPLERTLACIRRSKDGRAGR